MKRIVNLMFAACLAACTVAAQTPAELRSYLPVVDGWTLSAETEVFDEDNLFDRINGAAPLFIENNFQEMTSLEYTRGDEYITVQSYRHASPEDAFGMYTSERSSDLSFLPIGGEAQGDGKSIFFFSGNIYVKMWTNATEDISATLQTIATQLAQSIDPQAAYPALVKAFPAEGLTPYSVAYITSNYIGHEFLQSVYTAAYNQAGRSFQAFIIDAKSTEGARELLDKYFAFARQTQEYTEGPLVINDRYNGDIPVYWKGPYIVGIFKESGDPVTPQDETFVKQLASGL
ncbi:MAG: hypothetical protein LUG98_00775 [Tannerellaceae bacterium]|nr:hypothetical protein [Tannerellaceae bacterium]